MFDVIMITYSRVLLLVALGLSAAYSQQIPRQPSGEEMAKLLELTKPGPEHALLKEFKGKWALTVKTGTKKESKGNASSFMTMEDRFLWISYDARGQAGRFKGGFIIGFDRRHGHFTLLAMDIDGTYYVESRGVPDEGSKVVRLYGKDDDPYMKQLGLEKEFAHELDLRDPDKLTIAVFYIDTRTPARKELEAFTLEFRRKAEPEPKGGG
ncbi:MAG: DUF1579 family protein [Verrucomicrobiota bacterium]